jgi:uncharacterized integral membrane protein
MKAKAIVILIFVGLFLVLLVQNRDVVPFRFLFWTISGAKLFMMTLVMFIGFVVGFLVARFVKVGGKPLGPGKKE